jgi:membrane glycosyltransferase
MAKLFLLLLFTIGLLYGPKFLALYLLPDNSQEAGAHGGQLGATRSVLIEGLFSTLRRSAAALASRASNVLRYVEDTARSPTGVTIPVARQTGTGIIS